MTIKLQLVNGSKQKPHMLIIEYDFSLTKIKIVYKLKVFATNKKT